MDVEEEWINGYIWMDGVQVTSGHCTDGQAVNSNHDSLTPARATVCPGLHECYGHGVPKSTCPAPPSALRPASTYAVDCFNSSLEKKISRRFGDLKKTHPSHPANPMEKPFATESEVRYRFSHHLPRPPHPTFVIQHSGVSRVLDKGVHLDEPTSPAADRWSGHLTSPVKTQWTEEELDAFVRQLSNPQHHVTKIASIPQADTSSSPRKCSLDLCHELKDRGRVRAPLARSETDSSVSFGDLDACPVSERRVIAKNDEDGSKSGGRGLISGLSGLRLIKNKKIARSSHAAKRYTTNKSKDDHSADPDSLGGSSSSRDPTLGSSVTFSCSSPEGSDGELAAEARMAEQLSNGGAVKEGGKKRRFRKMLSRPLNRSHSAGCAKDVPAHALFLEKQSKDAESLAARKSRASEGDIRRLDDDDDNDVEDDASSATTVRSKRISVSRIHKTKSADSAMLATDEFGAILPQGKTKSRNIALSFVIRCVVFGAPVHSVWCASSLCLVRQFVVFGAPVRCVWCTSSLCLVHQFVVFGAPVRCVWCASSLCLVRQFVVFGAPVRCVWCTSSLCSVRQFVVFGAPVRCVWCASTLCLVHQFVVFGAPILIVVLITLEFNKTFRMALRRSGAYDLDAKKISRKMNFLRRRHTDSTLGMMKNEDGARRLATVDPEEAREWSKSFENLLFDKTGLELFRGFLISEHSDENIEFWIACENYKNTKSSKHLPSLATKIFNDYVAVQSKKEINLDSKTRSLTFESVTSTPNRQTFDEAQKRVQALMEKDSYRRFLESEIYLDLTAGNIQQKS
ncbi:hypothetical protein Btru_025758 [Bulinus truncatus]|nr:hypothetical protein Btru_025758 [Bulinus truncatus]